MQWYSQTPYADTIPERGSLITSFCNLLLANNKDVAPDVFLRILTAMNAHGRINWSTISVYDKQYTVNRIQSAPPVEENSILRFRFYSEKYGREIDHYCYVSDSVNHKLIDSLDGQEKPFSTFGDIVEWSSFKLSQEEPTTEVIEEEKPTETKIIRNIEYEVLTSPRRMFIVASEGAKKYSFGNVQTWQDIKVTGPRYPFGAAIDIVAIAHVPIGEIDVAAYYMDALAVGDFKHTGRVNFTIGFAIADLSIHAPPKPISKPVVLDQPVLMTTESEPKIRPNQYKATFRTFGAPARYVLTKNVIVHDLDNIRPPKSLQRYDEVLIGGTFTKDSVVYARPVKAIEYGRWFGIPLKYLDPYVEVYNTDVSLPEKVHLQSELTTSEELTIYISRCLHKYTSFKSWLRNKIKQSLQ